MGGMRNADVPGWALAGGIVAVAAVVLGLASVGGVVGIVLVAAVLGAVVLLLRTWTVNERLAVDAAAGSAEPQTRPDE
jgi:hypothetical protein